MLLRFDVFPVCGLSYTAGGSRVLDVIAWTGLEEDSALHPFELDNKATSRLC